MATRTSTIRRGVAQAPDTKSNPKQPPTQVATNAPANAPRPAGQTTAQPYGPAAGQPANRPIVRLTVPPVQPLDPDPIVRGAAPAPEQVGQKFASLPPLQAPGNPNWTPIPGSPPPAVPSLPVPVTLGAIQPDYPMPPPPPRNVSPVGFPR